MEREARPDVVREAAPLAHVAPEAGRDAAAEDLGRDPRGRDERMAERDRRRADEEVRLLEVRPREVKGAAGGAGLPGRGREGSRSAAPARARPRENSATRRSGSNAPAATTSVRSGRKIARNRRTRRARVRPLTVSAVPKIGAPSACAGQRRRTKRVVQEVVGHVLRLGHLLEDDAALDLHVRGRERGLRT